MIPNKLSDNAEAVRSVYAKAEEEILRMIAKRLAKGGQPSYWMTRKQKELTAMRRDMDGILKRLSAESKEKRDEMLDQSYVDGWMDFDRELQQLYNDGRPTLDIPKARLHATVELQNEMDERFKAVHSEILRDVNDEFRRIIGEAVSMESTGLLTWRQTQQQALNKFAARGITGFIDRAGRKWNLDTYAEMAVRTGMMKAALKGMQDDALAHDEHLVIITDHMDTCPLCSKWERKILSIDGGNTDGLGHKVRVDGTVAEAEKAGLFHPNCLHAATVYVAGLTDTTGMKEQRGYTKLMDAIGYNNRQKQRAMERNVRHWKRMQAAAMTPERERECQARVRQWQRALREFTEETGLPRKYDREGGKVILSPAARKLKPVALNTTSRNVSRWSNDEEYYRAKSEALEKLDKINDRFEELLQEGKSKLIEEFGGPFMRQRIAIRRDSTLTDEEKIEALAKVKEKELLYASRYSDLYQSIRDKIDKEIADLKSTIDLDREFGKHDAVHITPEWIKEQTNYVNPKYKTGEYRYTANCQLCAPTMELRFRGYNVEALERNESKAYLVGIKSNFDIHDMIQEDTRDPVYAAKKVYDVMREWGDGSRAMIQFSRGANMSGHVYNVVNIAGDVYFVDGQASGWQLAYKYIDGSMGGFDDNISSFALMRTDNADATLDVLDCCKVRR